MFLLLPGFQPIALLVALASFGLIVLPGIQPFAALSFALAF